MSQTAKQKAVPTSEAHHTASFLKPLVVSTPYHLPLVPPRVIKPHHTPKVIFLGSAPTEKKGAVALLEHLIKSAKMGPKLYSWVQLSMAECGQVFAGKEGRYSLEAL